MLCTLDGKCGNNWKKVSTEAARQKCEQIIGSKYQAVTNCKFSESKVYRKNQQNGRALFRRNCAIMM